MTTLAEMDTINIRLPWRLIKLVAVRCYCYGYTFEEYVLYALRRQIDYQQEH